MYIHTVYPPTLRSIPSEQPGGPGSNLEFLDSLEFLSRMWSCREGWPLPLLTPHPRPIPNRVSGACLQPPQPAHLGSTTHPNFSHYWPLFRPRDAHIDEPSCPWGDGPRKEALEGRGRG